MPEQKNERLEAFENARKLVNVVRAKEILRWKNWRHGGVLGGHPSQNAQIFPKLKTKQFISFG